MDLADADAVGEALRVLQADAALEAAFGGPGHVSGIQEAPWPHLVVSPGGFTNIGDRSRSVDSDVLLEVVGPFEATVSSRRLWELLHAAIAVLTEHAEKPTEDGCPVWSRPEASALNRQQLASGQTKWSANVAVVVTPPTT